jgi:hypothetical protein
MPTIGAMMITDLTNVLCPRMNDVLEELGDPPRANIWDLLVDPPYDVSSAINSQVLSKNIANSLDVASCYPTAQFLFPVLTGVAPQITAGRNLDAYLSVGEFQTEVTALTNLIESNRVGNRDVVYRVEYAGHGFILVGRDSGNGYAIELLETTASITTISTALTYPARTPDVVRQALQDMGSAVKDTRLAGALVMGWQGGDLFLGDQVLATDPVFPGVKMKWWAAPLAGDWRARWGQQITARYQVLSRWAGV